MSEEEIEAYNWLCSLEVEDEAEAVNKIIVLNMLDKYKFNDYFRRKEMAEKWKIN